MLLKPRIESHIDRDDLEQTGFIKVPIRILRQLC